MIFALLPMLLAAEPIQLEGVRALALEEDRLEIRAPTSTWDVAARHASFSGGVVAQRGPLELHCDALDVTYSADGSFQIARATGGVEATREDWTAHAESAVLDLATGELTLESSANTPARLSDGVNLLEGLTIVFALDDERVDCRNCRLVVGAGTLGDLSGSVP